MTGEEVLNLVMFRCGHNTSAALRSAAVLEAKLAQTEMEGDTGKPWFMFSHYTDAAFATVANQEYVDLPDTFIGLEEDQPAVWWYNSESTNTDKWEPLKRAVWSDIKNYYQDRGTGAPVDFDIFNNRIYMRPIPDAAYLLKLPGYFSQTAIADAAVETTWTKWAPDLLAAMTLVHVGEKHLQNLEISMQARADVGRAILRLKKETERRLHSGRDYVMGGAN
jgi:hypothetical protein